MKLIRVFNPKAREIIYTHIHDLGIDIGGILNVEQPSHIQDDPRVEDFQFFEVEDKRVKEVVDYITQIFPGKDVQVYQMTESAVRPAGDLIRKKVTTEGVLPF